MASIYISCPTSVSALHYDHNRMSRNISRFHKKPNSTHPTTISVTTDAPIVRRTANYPPSQWSYDYLQSLTTNYTVEKYGTRLHNLKERVRSMISKDTAVENPLGTLELVDDLQRLGISYHFKDEISSVLNTIYNSYYEANEKWKRLDLNLKALGFRLLRQQGYHIPQEIFEDIMEETTGNIKDGVREDIVGMLNLYEASFHSIGEEYILDKAREFTSECLNDMLKKGIVDQSMVMLTSHALELPLLWRIQRFEAIWYIETYKKKKNMKPLLLELAILDYNIVQGIHQEDLKLASRWWEGLKWDKKLSFARDRLVESVIWAIGMSYEPAFGLLRRPMGKIMNLINVIDDIYDVYGTLDELEQFTDVVRRWDINAMEELPYYMKICFLGFFNTINDMVYNTLTSQESLGISSVKNAWVDYCEANLIEARWFHSGYTPTLEEYLKISCTSIAVPVMALSAGFITSGDTTTTEDLDNIIHLSALILRLADDLATSSVELKRGDVPKTVQCYMHESGASEEEGKAYVKQLILETWKKLNKERMVVRSPSSRLFVEWVTNLNRLAQYTYQRGDMFGSPDDLYTSHQISLLFTPKS